MLRTSTYVPINMDTVDLIQRVKDHPILYNVADPHYKNIERRNDAWKDVAGSEFEENGRCETDEQNIQHVQY